MAAKNIPQGSKTTIEIPLHSIRRYVPGSGPPPPRITLAPPRDSTAYIIDQFILPTEKDTTGSSRRLIHYHIGFTDLPAAKLLIPCNEILDYVSPRELEDWEYRNSEKKAEEQARELAEKQRPGAATRKGPTQPLVMSPSDADASLLSRVDEALLLAKEVAGPSLSTPQKRKRSSVLDEEDTGETSNLDSDDAAIRRQLQGDSGAEETGIEGGAELDSDSVDQLPSYDDSKTPSRSGSSHPPRSDQYPVLSASGPTRAKYTSSAGEDSHRPADNTSSTARIHPAWVAFGMQNWSGESAGLQGQNNQAKQNDAAKNTPWLKGNADSSLESPVARGSTPNRAAKSVAVPDSIKDTEKKKRKETGNGTGGQPQTQYSPLEKQPKKRRKQQQDARPKDEPAEDEWEVKELLDDRVFFERGVKVHKYLVLWEGDWPEWQNPTWEPAENVQDETLIRRYREKKKAGLLKPPKKAQKTLNQYLVRSQYSSVAEAFEGGIDHHMAPAAGEVESDTEPPEERFLVTENEGDTTAAGPKPLPNFRAFDAMLARYNQAFRQS
ncbi:hypothetical protein VTK26DRAFT_7972 [Humicola hyalothermophila]